MQDGKTKKVALDAADHFYISIDLLHNFKEQSMSSDIISCLYV